MIIRNEVVLVWLGMLRADERNAADTRKEGRKEGCWVNELFSSHHVEPRLHV